MLDVGRAGGLRPQRTATPNGFTTAVSSRPDIVGVRGRETAATLVEEFTYLCIESVLNTMSLRSVSV